MSEAPTMSQPQGESLGITVTSVPRCTIIIIT